MSRTYTESLLSSIQQASTSGSGVAGGTLFPNAGNATKYDTKFAPIGEIRLQTNRFLLPRNLDEPR